MSLNQNTKQRTKLYKAKKMWIASALFGSSVMIMQHNNQQTFTAFADTNAVASVSSGNNDDNSNASSSNIVQSSDRTQSLVVSSNISSSQSSSSSNTSSSQQSSTTLSSSQRDDLTTMISNLSNQLVGDETQLNDLQTSFQSFGDMDLSTRIGDDFSDVKTKFDDLRQSKQNEINDLQNKINDLQNQLNSINSQIQDKHNVVNSDQNQINDLQNKINDYKNQASQVQDLINQTNDKLSKTYSTSFTNLSEDKAIYKPGDTVGVTATGDQNDSLIRVHVFKNGQEIDYFTRIMSTKDFYFSWKTPDNDNSQYLMKIETMDKNGGMTSVQYMGINVASDPANFPIMGYLSNYDMSDKAWLQNNIDWLKRMHINYLQYYDWANNNDNVDTADQGQNWTQLTRTPVTIDTMQAYLNAAKNANMQNMAYLLLYGASSQIGEGYWDADDFLYTNQAQAGTNAGIANTTFSGNWAKNNIYYLNYMRPQTQAKIIAKFDKVFKDLNWDGIHLDTLGALGPLWAYEDGKTYEISSDYMNGQGFTDFFNVLKQHYGNSKRFEFNAVAGDGGQQAASADALNIMYSEQWSFQGGSYNDLFNHISQLRAQNPNKQIVIPAYLGKETDWSNKDKTFNEAGLRLLNNVIMASGATHLEVGIGADNNRAMLNNEYFPNDDVKLTDTLQNYLVKQYDFEVAYHNLLNINNKTDSGRFSDLDTTHNFIGTNATSVIENSNNDTTVWSIFNTKGLNGDDWVNKNNDRNYVPAIENVHFRTDKNFKHVYIASIEGPEATELQRQADGSYLIPKINDYALIWGTNDDETHLAPNTDDASVVTQGQNRLNALNMSLNDKNGKASDANNQINDLKNQINDANNQLGNLQGQTGSINDSINSNKATIDDLQKQISTINDQQSQAESSEAASTAASQNAAASEAAAQSTAASVASSIAAQSVASSIAASQSIANSEAASKAASESAQSVASSIAAQSTADSIAASQSIANSEAASKAAAESSNVVQSSSSSAIVQSSSSNVVQSSSSSAIVQSSSSNVVQSSSSSATVQSSSSNAVQSSSSSATVQSSSSNAVQSSSSSATVQSSSSNAVQSSSSSATVQSSSSNAVQSSSSSATVQSSSSNVVQNSSSSTAVQSSSSNTVQSSSSSATVQSSSSNVVQSSSSSTAVQSSSSNAVQSSSSSVTTQSQSSNVVPIENTNNSLANTTNNTNNNLSLTLILLSSVVSSVVTTVYLQKKQS